MVITDDNSVMQTFWHSINITESAVLSNYIPAGQLTMLALGIHWSCRIGHMCCCVEFQDTASRDDADGSGQAAKHLSVLLAHLWNMPFPMEQQQPWDQPWQVDSHCHPKTAVQTDPMGALGSSLLAKPSHLQSRKLSGFHSSSKPPPEEITQGWTTVGREGWVMGDMDQVTGMKVGFTCRC